MIRGDNDNWLLTSACGYEVNQERRSMTRSLRIPVKAFDGALFGVIEVSGVGEILEHRIQMQVELLAAQAAVAVQKIKLLADLQKERAVLERANETKDQFLSVLSHELRTPLTPILGWITMLRQRRVQLEKADDAFAAIERNARLELHLVEQMLDLSRILNNKVILETTLVSPADVLASALGAAQSMVNERDLSLELETSADLPPVLADPRRLQQVLSNLIANAIKFTEDGGRITLGARLNENYVEFFVADTGVGIPHDALPHIFERFQQADSSTTRRFGGLGIGLSVVRGLVEMHGGIVWAVSYAECDVSKRRFGTVFESSLTWSIERLPNEKQGTVPFTGASKQ